MPGTNAEIECPGCFHEWEPDSGLEEGEEITCPACGMICMATTKTLLEDTGRHEDDEGS